MTQLTEDELSDIERLEKAATPGPWQSLRDGNQYVKVETDNLPSAELVGASRVDGLVRPWNPHALIALGFKPGEHETARFLDVDADFIAASRTIVPKMAAAIWKLREAHPLWQGKPVTQDQFDTLQHNWEHQDASIAALQRKLDLISDLAKHYYDFPK